jgi:hypothetical protein
LEGLEICSSDPLCAETSPESAFTSLHGAACHNCRFLSETIGVKGLALPISPRVLGILPQQRPA